MEMRVDQDEDMWDGKLVTVIVASYASVQISFLN